jgi:hypothetical protein
MEPKKLALFFANVPYKFEVFVLFSLGDKVLACGEFAHTYNFSK